MFRPGHIIAGMFCVCSFFILEVAIGETVSLYAIADTYADSGEPDTNKGSNTGFATGNISGFFHRSYLKFNLSSIPAGQSILFARLRLSASFISLPEPELGAHYLKDDGWGEMTLTWNNAPTDFEETATDVIIPGIDDNFWTVTKDVDDAYWDDGYYTVVVKSENEGLTRGASFYSIEWFVEDDFPYLEVEYGAQKYSGGDGSAEEPYRIATPNDLNDIGNHVEDFNKCFVMVNDVNLACYTGTQFNIIGERYFDSGWVENPFTGVFDGNGHTISNFSYNSTATDYIAIFGYVDDPNAEIINLGLIDPNVEVGTGWNVGSLIGCLISGTITDCYVAGGKITGYGGIGGLIGVNLGVVSDCNATADVSGYVDIGGLVGSQSVEGRITNCNAAGSVTAMNRSEALGGLVGYNDGRISNCYATGSVTAGEGSQDIGGLVGDNYSYGIVSNCYATGSVTGAYGSDAFGGLVGWNVGVLTECYAAGEVSGYWFTGGLVGLNSGNITDSYANVEVFGDADWTGGLVGYNYEAAISNCYATGSVSGNGSIGGLVGYDSSGSYTSCFWDSDVNPDVNGIGNGSDPNVIGLTTAEMQTESTFTDAGWDFVEESINGMEDIWRLCNVGAEYPHLNWQFLLADFVCPDGVEINDLAVLFEQWLLEELTADVWPDGGDGFVNFLDWAVFADGWQNTNDIDDLAVFVDQWLQLGAYCADIGPDGGDGVVNMLDFAVFANHWLEGI